MTWRLAWLSLSFLVLPCPSLSFLVLPCPSLSFLVLPCPSLSFLVLPCLSLSFRVFPCLPFPSVSFLFLPFPSFFFLVLPCLPFLLLSSVSSLFLPIPDDSSLFLPVPPLPPPVLPCSSPFLPCSSIFLFISSLLPFRSFLTLLLYIFATCETRPKTLNTCLISLDKKHHKWHSPRGFPNDMRSKKGKLTHPQKQVLDHLSWAMTISISAIYLGIIANLRRPSKKGCFLLASKYHWVNYHKPLNHPSSCFLQISSAVWHTILRFSPPGPPVVTSDTGAGHWQKHHWPSGFRGAKPLQTRPESSCETTV